MSVFQIGFNYSGFCAKHAVTSLLEGNHTTFYRSVLSSSRLASIHLLVLAWPSRWLACLFMALSAALVLFFAFFFSFVKEDTIGFYLFGQEDCSPTLMGVLSIRYQSLVLSVQPILLQLLIITAVTSGCQFVHDLDYAFIFYKLHFEPNQRL